MAIGAEEYCEAVLIRHLPSGAKVNVVESGVGVSTADVADTRLCAEDGFFHLLFPPHLVL